MLTNSSNKLKYFFKQIKQKILSAIIGTQKSCKGTQKIPKFFSFFLISDTPKVWFRGCLMAELEEKKRYKKS